MTQDIFLIVNAIEAKLSQTNMLVSSYELKSEKILASTTHDYDFEEITNQTTNEIGEILEEIAADITLLHHEDDYDDYQKIIRTHHERRLWRRQQGKRTKWMAIKSIHRKKHNRADTRRTTNDKTARGSLMEQHSIEAVTQQQSLSGSMSARHHQPTITPIQSAGCWDQPQEFNHDQWNHTDASWKVTDGLEDISYELVVQNDSMAIDIEDVLRDVEQVNEACGVVNQKGNARGLLRRCLILLLAIVATAVAVVMAIFISSRH